MDTRYQILVAAVERAINEADPIGLPEIGAPSDEYAPEIRTILSRLESAKRLDDVTVVLHEEFLHRFGDGVAAPRESRIGLNDVCEQRARERDGSLPEREEPPRGVFREHRPALLLDELHQAVGRV